MSRAADVVVIGAGIAGVSAAYHLTVRHDVANVIVVDPRPPLTLTSDKSTECYRNWWPNAPMVGLMNRSIELFEELATKTEFGLNANGYLFVTADDAKLQAFADQVDDISGWGAEADLLGPEQLLNRYPFLTDRAHGGLFVPRAGWLRAQDLGQWMLNEARVRGAHLIVSEVVAVEPDRVALSDGSKIEADAIVIAAGPLTPNLAVTAGIDLPLFSELHLKVAFKDHMGVIPRDAPMTIWSDTQVIDWSESERIGLEELGRSDLLMEMPVYCHFRPEGGTDSPYVVALWEYHDQVLEPSWPLPEDPLYPEVVMRGLTTMVPSLDVYRERLPESHVDGGYYTKTPENRPLIGPSGVDGVHLLTGMSGFGVMVSPGAADLLARHIVGADLPEYADAFLLSRYDDPSYMNDVASAASGQL